MNSVKSAVVTWVTGQDGAYLAQLLLQRNYEVFTTYRPYRRTSSVNCWRMEELGLEGHAILELVEYDLTDVGTSICPGAAGAAGLYKLAA